MEKKIDTKSKLIATLAGGPASSLLLVLELSVLRSGGLALPEAYLAFMAEHDGGEGPIGRNNYGRFYRLEELEKINRDYDVAESWPGYAVIGGIDDTLWAYNPEKGIYCQIDGCNTDDDTYFTVSDSFESFLLNMDRELD